MYLHCETLWVASGATFKCSHTHATFIALTSSRARTRTKDDIGSQPVIVMTSEMLQLMSESPELLLDLHFVLR